MITDEPARMIVEEASGQVRAEAVGARRLLSDVFTRVRSGDIGSLPIFAGLVLISVLFQVYNPVFLSSANLVNIVIELAPIGTVALGVVLVLLVGQIDLSVGSMVGVASAILGTGLAILGWPMYVVIPLAILAGAVVGFVYGFVFLKFGVPSFVATLAGLLALLGLQLQILGTNGTINIPFDSWIVRLAQQMFLPVPVSYALVGFVGLGYLITQVTRARRRREAKLSVRSPRLIVVGTIGIVGIIGAFTWYLNQTRGVSTMFVFFVTLVALTGFLLRRTRWGRGIYAVGGSVEAARRAGIHVNRIYMSAFVACSTLAAVGGLLSAGRLAAASISSGTGTTNLNAIAAAVIGGTSLFGGRGGAKSALLGIVVVGAISNGLTLLSLDASARFMVTGAVLMLAVIVDSVAHRSRIAHGRA